MNAPLSASNGPDLAVDPNGNLYLCDLGNAMVMRVGRDGIINVIAGNGLVSVSGDGGLAVDASLYVPCIDRRSVAADRTRVIDADCESRSSSRRRAVVASGP